jgi:hypothetical protein
MSTFELKITGDDATVVRTEQVRLKSWDDHNVYFTVGPDGLFAISSEDGILIGREEVRSNTNRKQNFPNHPVDQI